MSFGPRFFSRWFLITLTSLNISAHAVQDTEGVPEKLPAHAACAKKLGTATALIKAPSLELSEVSRSIIHAAFTEPNLTDETRFERAKNAWLQARTRHYDTRHSALIYNTELNMRDESFYGLRVDQPLKGLMDRPGLNSLAIRLVDFVHQVESDILNLEFTEQIPQRPGVKKLGGLSALYRASVMASEHAVLSSIPVNYAREEVARINDLRIEDRLKKFAARLLAAPTQSFGRYKASHGSWLPTFGRTIEWQVLNDPSRADRDANRQRLIALLERWYLIDDQVFWTEKTAARGRNMAQARGTRPSGAAVALVDQTNAMRRSALEEEWQTLHNWAPRTRGASLVMLTQIDLNPAFKERVVRAISTSDLPKDEYFKVRFNRYRLTAPWTE